MNSLRRALCLALALTGIGACADDASTDGGQQLVAGRCVDDTSWCTDVPPSTATFADVPVGSTFHVFVEMAVTKGLLAPSAIGPNLEPGGVVTRRFGAATAYPTFLDRLH